MHLIDQYFVFNKRVLLISLFCITFQMNDLTISANRTCGLQPIFRSSETGDLRLTVIVNECLSSALSNTVVLTSAWLCDRLNVLDVLGGDIKLGADIYHVCNENDMIDPVVETIRNLDGYQLGVIAWNPVPRKIRALGNALHVPYTEVRKQHKSLITTTVGLLSALNWNENLTVVINNADILNLFYHELRKEWICIESVRNFRDTTSINYNNPVVMLGNGKKINYLVNNITNLSSTKIVVVPLDGSQVEGLPDGAYIIQPLYADNQQKLTKSPKIIPSPVLLDIALPMINLVKNISRVMDEHCNQTIQNSSCLKHDPDPFTTQMDVLKFLKIEPLADRFNYNIFKVEHLDIQAQKVNDSLEFLQSYIKVGVYNLFNFTLILDGLKLEDDNFTLDNDSVIESCSKNHKLCVKKCVNFKLSTNEDVNDEQIMYNIVLKQDPWILAVLSIATLGVVFCLAILIFIFIRLCKKDIFEGNPVLSVLLLLTLTVMYASVVPFALEVTSETEFRTSLGNYLCLIRSLVVTMSYSCAFSLMLSRCVMLATVAYEAGFMSHITGHVQSLLCLFMIAVQGALSLQSFENCQELFSGSSFIYVLSYDILLLGLLLCSCPFVCRSQRNYREGGYFTVAIMLVCLVWIGWITAFVLVEERWKMAVVCSGLLGTASSILGAVFIPRTYLMTSAVVRDNLTSALPSLALANSASVLDLNYSNAQHVYDCVNIATINAVGMTQGTLPLTSAPTTLQQSNPNFYSDEPGLIETTERYEMNPSCDSPDKVTRF